MNESLGFTIGVSIICGVIGIAIIVFVIFCTIRIFEDNTYNHKKPKIYYNTKKKNNKYNRYK